MGNEHSSGSRAEQATAFRSISVDRRTKPAAASSADSPHRSLQHASRSLSLRVGRGDATSGSDVTSGSGAGTSGAGLHRIVVVKESVAIVEEKLEDDPDIQRLRAVPRFYPIIPQTATGSIVKDLDVSDGVDCVAGKALLARYQDHVHIVADSVAKEQLALTRRIADIDFVVSTLHNRLSEKQKKISRHSEQLHATMKQIEQSVNSCELMLAKCVRDSAKLVDLMTTLGIEVEPLDRFEFVTG